MKSIWTLSLALLLSACLSNNNDQTASGGAQPTPVTPAEVPTVSKFSIANQCYGLQSVFSRQYIKTTGNRYTAGPATEAESFTLRPASLGNYLIYGRDKQMVTAQGSTTAASAEPTDAAIWKAEFDDKKGVFRFFDSTGQLLALDDTQGLVLTSTDSEKSQFKLMAATLHRYPEMPPAWWGPPTAAKERTNPSSDLPTPTPTWACPVKCR